MDVTAVDEQHPMIGPYRVELLLGKGGMGEVYRAVDTRRDRIVALKVLPPATTTDEQYRMRFRRESDSAARLTDPHVIPIHDFGEVDGRLFIDMRLVAGEGLDSVLGSGPLSPERAVSFVVQIAEALTDAHTNGVVHRDVKPSNVLVTKSDFVYLVDFGIARASGGDEHGLTQTGTMIGTLAYMAPERFDGGAPDHRSDIYSLACVLAECLIGQPPFGESSAASMMRAHLVSDPPQPSRNRKEVPRGLDDVIARGMAKDPSDRYQSALDLAIAAKQALRSRTAHLADTSAAPETTMNLTPSPNHTAVASNRASWIRSRTGLICAATILAAATGLGGYAVGQNTSTSTPSAAGLSAVGGISQQPADGSRSSGASDGTPAGGTTSQTFKVGDQATNGGAFVTVKNVVSSSQIEVNNSNYRAGSGLEAYTMEPAGPGAKFIIVSAHVINNAKKSMDLTCGYPIASDVVDDQGRHFDPIQSLYKIRNNPECNKKLQPGFDSDMTWAYIAPTSSHITDWRFKDASDSTNDGVWV